MRAPHPRRTFRLLSFLLAAPLVACGGGEIEETLLLPANPSSGGQGGSQAGQAGQAGVGGAAGKAGSGGSAGTAGVGGSAGSAGVAGQAGAAGEAGFAGTSGASGAAGGNSCESGVPCGDACVETDTDPAHCGACDNACDATHGTPSCAAGACAITCDEGFANCDGDAKNGCEVEGTCACVPGESVPCYSGPEGTQGVGACVAGTHVCDATGTGFGECVGEVLPTAETCLTTVDDDCNGQVNEAGEGCSCVPGSVAPCYGGPDGTEGVGACVGGTQTCKADGTGYDACVGAVLPAPESCLTPAVDDDCDGSLNEDGEGCVCVPGAVEPCYEGADGTAGVGACVAGTRTCADSGTGFGACTGQVLPALEVCDGALVDENCDGVVNEGGTGCLCVPGSKVACYTGPAGTEGVGVCKGGQKTCDATGTAYGPCDGEVVPAPKDSCATVEDEDCTGSSLTCAGADEDCGPVTGDCVSACADEIVGKSYQGCEYFPTVTPNLVDGATFAFSVIVSNTTPKEASVTITRGGSEVATVQVPADGVQIVNLPWISQLKGPTNQAIQKMPGSVQLADGAYRLTSTRPVTVYQYNPLDYTKGAGSFSYSNDASLLIPSNAWTKDYRALARHHFSGASGFVSVVASEDETQVTFAAGPQSGLIKAGIAGLSTTGEGTVTLDAGDVALLVTDGSDAQSDANDPTGMHITSTKPIQVIGGHQCTFVPATTGYCDHLEESIFPVETLSTTYLLSAPLISGANKKAQLVRVVATEPNTTLSYDPPQAGAPTSIAAAGGWVELPSSSADFRLTASAPVLVAQYGLGQLAGGDAGDPALTLAVGTAQYRTSYLFHAPTNYSTSYVNITAPTGAVVTVDGTAVAASSFSAVGTTGFGIARIALSNAGDGNHRVISDKPVGVQVYGYGQYTSYWYPGGLDLATVDAP